MGDANFFIRWTRIQLESPNNPLGKQILSGKQQQPAKAAAKIEISSKRLWNSVPVAGGVRVRFRVVTVRADSVVIGHTGLLSLEWRGVAVVAT